MNARIKLEKNSPAYLAELAINDIAKEYGYEPVYCQGSFWVPIDSLWQKLTESDFKRILIKYDYAKVKNSTTPLKIRKNLVAEVMYFAKNERTTDETFFDDALGLICNNGAIVRNPKTGCFELTEKDPKYRIRNQSAANYDSSAKTNRVKAAIASGLGSVSDIEHITEAIFWWLGAALLGDATKEHIALYFWGDGGSGKSAFAHILASIFPRESVTYLEPSKWGTIEVAQLEKSLLNIASENQQRKGGNDSATYNKVICGENVTVNPKYETPYDFRPRAAHIILTNAPPGSTYDNAKERRQWILRWNAVVKEENKNFVNEVVANEIDGLFTAAIHAYNAALLAGGMNEPQSSIDAKAAARTETDSVAQFITSYFIHTVATAKTQWIKTKDLYPQYVSYCKDSGLNPVNVQNFNKRVRTTKLDGKQITEGKDQNLICFQLTQRTEQNEKLLRAVEAQEKIRATN